MIAVGGALGDEAVVNLLNLAFVETLLPASKNAFFERIKVLGVDKLLPSMTVEILSHFSEAERYALSYRLASRFVGLSAAMKVVVEQNLGSADSADEF